MTFTFRAGPRSHVRVPPAASVFHLPAPGHLSCSTWSRMITLAPDAPGNSLGRSEGLRGSLHKSLNQLAMQMRAPQQLFLRQRPFIFRLLLSCSWATYRNEGLWHQALCAWVSTKIHMGLWCASSFQKAFTQTVICFNKRGLELGRSCFYKSSGNVESCFVVNTQ